MQRIMMRKISGGILVLRKIFAEIFGLAHDFCWGT